MTVPAGQLDAAALRALLAVRGLTLRPEDESATLATARFLAAAAATVRRAAV